MLSIGQVDPRIQPLDLGGLRIRRMAEVEILERPGILLPFQACHRLLFRTIDTLVGLVCLALRNLSDETRKC